MQTLRVSSLFVMLLLSTISSCKVNKSSFTLSTVFAASLLFVLLIRFDMLILQFGSVFSANDFSDKSLSKTVFAGSLVALLIPTCKIMLSGQKFNSISEK